ncbi:unnamed protein product [Aureobasidium mustum]|uniref:Uncharacterized protein n=1 Tax=Aureobasidium mustum TaxID=2773714 RepID=A0A9N8JYU5_9PEZI|nr:unnamed protein product [Aureobasidium mustum]
MGTSVTSLAKNARRTALKASPKGARGLSNASKLAQLFAQRYPYNGKSLSTDLDAVEKHVKSQFSDPENFAFEGFPPTDEVAAQVRT